MKRQWLGMIGLRLVGVYALIEALASFPRLAAGGMLLARDGRGGLIPFLVLFPYGVLLASGVLLLAHPAKAAGLVWPRGVGADDVQISADVANLAFAAAGIIVLVLSFLALSFSLPYLLPVRCPKCSGKMRFRFLKQKTDSRQMYAYICEQCTQRHEWEGASSGSSLDSNLRFRDAGRIKK